MFYFTPTQGQIKLYFSKRCLSLIDLKSFRVPPKNNYKFVLQIIIRDGVRKEAGVFISQFTSTHREFWWCSSQDVKSLLLSYRAKQIRPNNSCSCDLMFSPCETLGGRKNSIIQWESQEFLIGNSFIWWEKKKVNIAKSPNWILIEFRLESKTHTLVY